MDSVPNLRRAKAELQQARGDAALESTAPESTMALAIAAIVMFGAVLWIQKFLFFPLPQSNTVIVFFVGLIATQLAAIWWPNTADINRSFSWVFASAMVLSGAPLWALLALAAVSFITSVISNRDTMLALFASSRMVVSVAAGAIVVSITGQQTTLISNAPVDARWLMNAFAAVAAVVVTHAVTAGQSSDEGDFFNGIGLFSYIPKTILTDAALMTLAPISVVVAERSLALLPLLLVNALTVHQTTLRASTREHEANHDGLTGLPNRRPFREKATTSVASGRASALVVIDLDGFKRINDHLGHHVGDVVLKVVAERLNKSIRPEDTVARLGGDEFAMFMEGEFENESITRVLEHVLAEVKLPFEVEGNTLQVGASFGVALAPEHGSHYEDLIERADAAMYNAKRNSLGVVVFDPANQEENHGRQSMLVELREAIDHDELVVHYQPWVDTASRSVVGIEAFVRWPHRKRGLLMPGEFVPLVQDGELSTALNKLLINKTLRDCARWQRAGYNVPVALNLLPLALLDTDLPDYLANRIRNHQLKTSSVQVEFDDRFVSDSQLSETSVLRDLRHLGVGVTLDDFGTGTGSLSHLRATPVDSLKLDRKLIQTVGESAASRAIVRSLIAMATELNISLIAKGVEELDTVQILHALGCHEMQGYLITRPLTSSQLAKWLPMSSFSVSGRSRRQIG